MTDLSEIPTEEMIDDYYASLMDYETSQRLYRSDLADDLQLRLKHRIVGNRQIMNTILAELKRRGIDHTLPAPIRFGPAVTP